MKFVRKRDGRLEPFDQERIINATWKAAKVVGRKDDELARRLTDQVAFVLAEDVRFNEPTEGCGEVTQPTEYESTKLTVAGSNPALPA
jgi:anaerobic ribonucleoside-triphosphate reductase